MKLNKIGLYLGLILVLLVLVQPALAEVKTETEVKTEKGVENDSSLNTPDVESSAAEIPCAPLPPPLQDPLESLNRITFKFNDFLDTYILKPVSQVYIKITPKPIAKAFSNFLNNIDTVPTILNDLLQGNFYQATSDTWRLAVNSTAGLLGFIDVASCIGLEPNSEDFGLTLAHWGWKDSYYFVIPFLGPSTIRDAIGVPMNYYYLSVYPYVKSSDTLWALYAFNLVVKRSDLLRYENVMDQVAIDKYVFIRDAYVQHRNYLIDRNKQLGDPYLQKNKPDSCG